MCPVTPFFDFSGLLPPGTQFDLFRGTAAMKQDVEDMYPTTVGHTIKVTGISKLKYDDGFKIACILRLVFVSQLSLVLLSRCLIIVY